MVTTACFILAGNCYRWNKLDICYAYLNQKRKPFSKRAKKKIEMGLPWNDDSNPSKEGCKRILIFLEWSDDGRRNSFSYKRLYSLIYELYLKRRKLFSNKICLKNVFLEKNLHQILMDSIFEKCIDGFLLVSSNTTGGVQKSCTFVRNYGRDTLRGHKRYTLL